MSLFENPPSPFLYILLLYGPKALAGAAAALLSLDGGVVVIVIGKGVIRIHLLLLLLFYTRETSARSAAENLITVKVTYSRTKGILIFP